MEPLLPRCSGVAIMSRQFYNAPVKVLCLDTFHMPPRNYRKGKQLGLWVSDETAERLSALSKKVGEPQSALLRRALELLFEKYEPAPKPRKSAR